MEPQWPDAPEPSASDLAAIGQLMHNAISEECRYRVQIEQIFRDRDRAMHDAAENYAHMLEAQTEAKVCRFVAWICVACTVTAIGMLVCGGH